MGHLIFCLRLVEAALLGGLVGLERELAGKHAGLRTNLLICVGSALLTQLSLALPASTGGGDPGRIAAQIVTGVGFLGAGTILQSRHAVHGLTSAATIWVVAGLGIAVGAGIDHDAFLATLLVLAALVVLRGLERRLLGQQIVTISVRTADHLPDPEVLLAEVGPRRRLLRSEWQRAEGGPGLWTLSWKGAPADAERMAAIVRRAAGAEVDGWRVED